jgi:hypothetical protein
VKRALVLVIAACSRRDPIATCDDDLRGVYTDGDERWMLIDHGATLEAYPLFPDGVAPDPNGPNGSTPAEIVVAPRVVDFFRRARPGTPGTSPGSSDSPESPDVGPQRATGRALLGGTLRRRYMRHVEHCDAHVPVHITRCAGDTLELVLADPSPPLDYAPCTWPRPGPSRLVRWRRE